MLYIFLRVMCGFSPNTTPMPALSTVPSIAMHFGFSSNDYGFAMTGHAAQPTPTHLSSVVTNGKTLAKLPMGRQGGTVCAQESFPFV